MLTWLEAVVVGIICYLCNQCLWPLKLWVRTPFMARLYSIQHYVIKFVSGLREVCGFLCVLLFSPPIKLTRDITEILLKVALHAINKTTPSQQVCICDLAWKNISYTYAFILQTRCAQTAAASVPAPRMKKFSIYRYVSIQCTCIISLWGNLIILFTDRIHEICQFCQTWPAKYGQILLRNDTRLVFCNGKLMRTDIFFTRTTKPICNFMNPVVRKDMDGLSIRGSTRYFNCLKWSLVPPDIKVLYKILMSVVQILIKSTNNVPSVNSEVLVHLKNIKPWHRQLSASIFYWNLHNSIVNSMRTFCSFTRNCWIFPHTSSTNFKEKICDAIYCF